MQAGKVLRSARQAHVPARARLRPRRAGAGAAGQPRGASTAPIASSAMRRSRSAKKRGRADAVLAGGGVGLGDRQRQGRHAAGRRSAARRGADEARAGARRGAGTRARSTSSSSPTTPAQGDGKAAAKKHFERALELSQNKKLSPLVSYAEAVCVDAQDKKEFVRLLDKVIAFDVDSRSRSSPGQHPGAATRPLAAIAHRRSVCGMKRSL